MITALITAVAALGGAILGNLMNDWTNTRALRTEQVASAYAQYMAVAAARRPSQDTTARLAAATAAISLYGNAEVVDALARVQAAIDDFQAAPPAHQNPGGQLDAAVNEAIVAAMSTMRSHVGTEKVPVAQLKTIFRVPDPR